jgi:hypothetical protein
MDADGLDIQPFHVDVPQALLDDLHDRLVRVRWAEELDARTSCPRNRSSPRPSQSDWLNSGATSARTAAWLTATNEHRIVERVRPWQPLSGHDASQTLVTDIRKLFRHHTRRAADQFNAPAEGQGD